MGIRFNLELELNCPLTWRLSADVLCERSKYAGHHGQVRRCQEDEQRRISSAVRTFAPPTFMTFRTFRAMSRKAMSVHGQLDIGVGTA